MMTVHTKMLFAGLLLIVGGFVGGLVVSGRMSLTERSVAEPALEQSRPAGGAAGAPDLSSVAERAIKASVNISSTHDVRTDPFFQFFYGLDPVRPETSLGSGVVVSEDGYVLTNSHVIANAREIRVTLSGGRELQGKIIGVDQPTDLAVIKVAPPRRLETLPWGDSDKLRVAEWVLAVGNPFALSETVTLGIVSATGRQNPQLPSYNDFIQTDAAINPGNSGGALINSRGELVGITSMIYSLTGGYQGIGFAIPSNLARRIMDELRTTGEVVRGSIGHLTFRSAELTDGTRGVLIDQMYRSDPAFRAGLLPDDLIVRFNGREVTDAGQLQRLVADAKIGSRVRVDAIREGRRFSVDVPVVKMTPLRRRY